MSMPADGTDADAIAVISMAGRFPGAADVASFWRNLINGVEAITRFDQPPGRAGERFVGAEGILDDPDLFAAATFGYTPRDAGITDPQHRVCLEVVWEAMDTAGYVADPPAGPVGVFLGSTMSSYLVRNLLPDDELVRVLGGFRVLTRNDKDFLPATVSYKLGLSGPSMAVGTSCSSSLVAVHLAAQSLLSGESDMAIAGGVSLLVPSGQGYVYREDGIYSPDGHCRAFGAGASGTVGGSGVAAVLLKRWADARRDGDHVHALLLGSAVNNDGAAKAGFTAPGVAGQAAAIAEAHAVAGITAREVGLVEAHGTGTALGDVIEIEALTEAFRLGTPDRGFCAIGSVKSNIGHLDAAAGVAGLVKAVLAVEHGVVPATLHADPPNPVLDLPSTPFLPATSTAPWTTPHRRTAGVSAFGIGGTNAHVVIREATTAAQTPRTMVPLIVSAADPETLTRAVEELASWLESGGVDVDLAAVSRTLISRVAETHRVAVLTSDVVSAVRLLRAQSPARGYRFSGSSPRPTVVIDAEGLDLHADVLRALGRDPVIAQHRDRLGAEAAPRRMAEAMVAAIADLGLVGSEPGGAAAPGPPLVVDVRAALTGPDIDPVINLHASVAQAWASGASVDWARYRRSHPGRRTHVPARALHRERCWIDPPVPRSQEGDDGSLDVLAHGLLLTARTEQLSSRLDGALLDPLCAAVALHTLRRAGVRFGPDDAVGVADVHRVLEVLPPLQRLADFLLAILVEDDVLLRTGSTLAAGPRFTEVPTPQAAADDVLRAGPGLRGLVDLVMHCSDAYPAALSQPGIALSTLYPDGSGDLLERTLGAVAGSDDVGDAVAVLARIVARRVERDPGLRVLEVGAGGGRLSRALVDVLRRTGGRLIVTDVSRTAVDRLRHHAGNDPAGSPNVSFALFDVSRSPVSQGMRRGSFDMVVGLDVLHAAPDLPVALRNCADLLAPGGVLGLVETTAQHRWLSLVFGLSAAWWHFRDDLRDGSPLLDQAGWRTAVADLEDEQRVMAVGSGAAVVLARRAPSALSAAPSIENLPVRLPDLGDWCYLPGWRRVPPAPLAEAVGGVLRCVVFGHGDLAEAVAARLRARGVDAWIVERSAVGVPDGAIDRDSVRAVLDGGREPDAVLYLYPADGGPATTDVGEDQVGEDQEVGLHGIVAVAQAIGAQRSGLLNRLLVATRGAQHVIGGDLERPGQATAAAATAVIGLEYPTLRASVVDLPPMIDGDTQQLAALLVDELAAGLPETRVAIRRGHRWLPTVEPVHLPPSGGPEPGLHVVCGGAGGIGMALAEHLAAKGSPVVLTGRTALPAREDWDRASQLADCPDHVRAVVERLRRVAATGGVVSYEQVDITDLDGMQRVVDEAVERFGPLRGLVHAAGVTDPAGVIQRRDRQNTVDAMAAKLGGVDVLAQVAHAHRPSYVVLCSTIGTVLNKLKFGELGYLAGHEFLNAWAAHLRGGTTPHVVTIAWTDWVESGMWARAREQLKARRLPPGVTIRNDADLLLGLSNAEGVELFDRVVGHRLGPVVLVSTQPLDEMLLVQDQYRPVEEWEPDAAAGPDRGRGPGTSSVAEVVTAIWSELLGVEQIGPDDDFFELGGDSLVALRVISRIREETGVTLPYDDLYDTPTVRALAAFVESTSVVRPTGELGDLIISADGAREEIVI